MTLRRHPVTAAVLVAVCLVVVGLGALILHRQAERGTAGESGSIGPGWHTAHAAFGLSDSRFAIEVTGVDTDAHPAGAPAAPGGYHYVTVDVDFTNHSRAQQRADPMDFTLLAAGTSRAPTFVSGTSCRRWPTADLHPAGDAGAPPRDAGAQQAGPDLGPRTLCFLAGGSPSAKMTLVWSPDVSIAFLGDPTTIGIG